MDPQSGLAVGRRKLKIWETQNLLPLPTFIESIDHREGKLRALVDSQMVRVMRFIPGKILFDVEPWTTRHFFQARSLKM